MEKHPDSVLRWVRPVKEHDSLLLGDMTTADGTVVCMGDVVDLTLIEARPDGSHIEDWVADFVRSRPRILRRLTGEKRATFLAEHCDRRPAQVLHEQTRSLCLICPDDVWASFVLDPYSHKYEARIGFRLARLPDSEAAFDRGVHVTDLKWRALGRHWLAEDAQSHLELRQPELCERLGAEQIYLSMGLGRPFKGRQWILVVGVHPVPDYEMAIDYTNL